MFLNMPCWVGMCRNTWSVLVLSYVGRVPLVFWGVSGETKISFRSFKQVAWLCKHHSWQYLSIQDIDLVEQTFLSSLSNFEKALFGFMGNPHTFEVSPLLGVNAVIPEGEGDGVVFPTPQTTFTLFNFQTICSVLCAYRLFNIISLWAPVSSVSALPPIPMFFTRVSSSKRWTPCMQCLPFLIYSLSFDH